MFLRYACIALGVSVAALGLATGDSLAQTAKPLDVKQWPSKELAGYLSANAMIGATNVYDQDGEMIGEVEDLIAGPDGVIKKLVIEAGGFLDIGDTHFAYPIAKANIEGQDRVEVRFDHDDIPTYSLFADIDNQPAAGRNWRLSELIGDWAHLKDGVRYGRVDDVLIGEDGEIKAVIVSADITYGIYGRPGSQAWPFYGYEYGFEPGEEFYAIPHSLDEIKDVEVFVYPRPPRQSG